VAVSHADDCDSVQPDTQTGWNLPGNRELSEWKERRCRAATAGNGTFVDDPAALILSLAWRSSLPSVMPGLASV
jgi:hypothetical protein